MTDPGASAEHGSFDHAVKWSLVMNIGNQLISTIVLLVIAALLGPEAFGTVALATVFLLFVQLFLEQGLTATIIQRKTLTDRHLDAAFWVIMATAVLLIVGTLSLAGWWAEVNHAPDLAGVLRVMSPIILIQALTIVQQALLQRSLRFKALALRANTASVMGGAVGIITAFAGAGVWALVAQQLVTQGIELVLLWAVSTWRPGLRFSRAAVADLYGFSRRVFLGSAGTFVQSQVDSIIIGVLFGPLAVGLYRMALRITRTIVDAFSQPVAMAALPAFSRSQDDKAELARTFRDSVGRSAGLVIPMAAGAAAVSDLFFRLLGDEWKGAAAVMVVFAVLAGARSLNNLCGPLLQATGRPGVTAALTWSLAAVNVAVFLVVASLVGDRGAPGQALAMAVGRTAPFTLIYLPITLTLAIRMAGSSFREILIAVRPALFSVPAIVVGARAAVAVLDSHLGDLGMFLVAVAVGGLAGGSVLVLTSPFWQVALTKALLVVRRNPPTAGTR
jgi:O-antigen/teichoic acid export membrane protein